MSTIGAGYGASPSQNGNLTIGAGAPDFGNLLGVDGERYSLSSFQDKRLLVLLFISNGCPTVKACQDRMIKIQKDYSEKKNPAAGSQLEQLVSLTG